jgi:hypothetical protein
MIFDEEPKPGGYGTVEQFIDMLEEARTMLTQADVALYAAGVRSDEVDEAFTTIREAMADRVFEFHEVADVSEV